MVHVNSRLIYRDLRCVFRVENPSELDIRCAQISVLFEDLRVELAGLGAESIPSLDTSGHRRIYFLRRSIATLKEFAHAVTETDRSGWFLSLRAKFDSGTAHRWARAVDFFHKHGKPLITPVRHSVGGHFHYDSAKYALSEFADRVIGGISVSFDPECGQTADLLFAQHIAAAALVEKVPGSVDYRTRYCRLFRVARVGYKHAVNCVYAIVSYHLWDRFEK